LKKDTTLPTLKSWGVGLGWRLLIAFVVAVFPDEVYRAPETRARRAYRNLIYFKEVDKGGRFAAWEQPELFAGELRAAFSSLRPAH
jgi:hypothetical protein